MHKAGQRGLVVVNERLADLDLDVKHYSVLSALREQASSQVALSEALRIDRTTVVQLIDDLEKKQLVRRTVNPLDRRAHMLKITKPGRQLTICAERQAILGDETFLAPLKRGEREQLKALLIRLL